MQNFVNLLVILLFDVEGTLLNFIPVFLLICVYFICYTSYISFVGNQRSIREESIMMNICTDVYMFEEK